MGKKLKDKYPELWTGLREYLDENYAFADITCFDEPIDIVDIISAPMLKCCEPLIEFDSSGDLDNIPDFGEMAAGSPSFRELLNEYLIKSEKTNAEVYQKALMSRQAFSKIINGDVMPKKSSVLSLAVAMDLSMDDTEHLLKTAGYALADSDISDVIVSYFIRKRQYDLMLINEFLDEYDQKLLGNVAI